MVAAELAFRPQPVSDRIARLTSYPSSIWIGIVGAIAHVLVGTQAARAELITVNSESSIMVSRTNSRVAGV